MISITSNGPVADSQPVKPAVDVQATPVAVPIQTPKEQPAIKASVADSVELSTVAQAKLLKQQGQTLSAIASQLGLDLKTVTSYVS